MRLTNCDSSAAVTLTESVATFSRGTRAGARAGDVGGVVEESLSIDCNESELLVA